MPGSDRPRLTISGWKIWVDGYVHPRQDPRTGNSRFHKRLNLIPIKVNQLRAFVLGLTPKQAGLERLPFLEDFQLAWYRSSSNFFRSAPRGRRILLDTRLSYVRLICMEMGCCRNPHDAHDKLIDLT